MEGAPRCARALNAMLEGVYAAARVLDAMLPFCFCVYVCRVFELSSTEPPRHVLNRSCSISPSAHPNTQILSPGGGVSRAGARALRHAPPLPAQPRGGRPDHRRGGPPRLHLRKPPVSGQGGHGQGMAQDVSSDTAGPDEHVPFSPVCYCMFPAAFPPLPLYFSASSVLS